MPIKAVLALVKRFALHVHQHPVECVWGSKGLDCIIMSVVKAEIGYSQACLKRLVQLLVT